MLQGVKGSESPQGDCGMSGGAMAEQCLRGPAQREGTEMEKKGNKASLPCPDDA